MSYVSVESLAGGVLLEPRLTFLQGYVARQNVTVPAGDAAATVYVRGGTLSSDEVDVFPNPDGSGTPLTQPLVPDAYGHLPGYVWQPRSLDLVYSSPGVPERRVAVGIPDEFAQVVAPAGGPGGSGIRGTLTSTSVPSPALDQFVFVEDEPFSAIGDANRGTVSVTAGSNVMTSAPGLQPGQRVEIVGAGTIGAGASIKMFNSATLSTGSPITSIALTTPSPVAAPATFQLQLKSGVNTQNWVLSAPLNIGDTVLSVVSQTPNFAYPSGSGFTSPDALVGWVHPTDATKLVTTLGGTSPLNAVSTVSNAVITYGSQDNDSLAWQNAHDHVEAKGGGTVACRPFKAFMLRHIFPGNQGLGNVRFSGAPGVMTTIYVDPGIITNGGQVFLYQTRSGFGLPGAKNLTFEYLRFVGHGFERTNQYAAILEDCDGITVNFCEFTDNASGALYLRDDLRCKLLNSNFVRICTRVSGLNGVDLVAGNGGATYPLQDFLVQGNTFKDGRSENISLVTDVSSTKAANQTYGRVLANYIDGPNGGTGIFFEGASALSTVWQVVIANNTVTTTSATPILVDNDSSISSPDPTCDAYVVIMGNAVSGNNGILTNGSFVAIVANTVIAGGSASSYGIQMSGGQGHIVATGTTTTGSKVLTGVSLATSFTYNLAVASFTYNSVKGSQTLTNVSNFSGVANGMDIAGPGLDPIGTIHAFNSAAQTITMAVPAVSTQTGATAIGDKVLTNVTPFPCVPIGTPLSGAGIPGGATVVSVNQNTKTIIMSAGGTSAQTAASGTATPPLSTVKRGWHLNTTFVGFLLSAFLQDGAGSSTWTLGGTTTATASGSQSFSLNTPGYACVCSSNVVNMGQNTSKGIQTGGMLHSTVNDNVIYYEPGSSSGTSGTGGINVQTCGWCDYVDNRVNDAPINGARITGSNDLTFDGNRIRNCSTAGAGSIGIRFDDPTAGSNNRIHANKIIDDRPTHLMANALQVGSGVNFSITNNIMLGQTGDPVSTFTSAITYWHGNQHDVPAWSQMQPGTVTGAGGTAVPIFYYVNDSPYPIELAWGGGTHSNFAFGRGSYATLSGALSTGAAITALPVNATRFPIPDGATLTVYSQNAGAAQTQTWTVSNGGVPVPAGSTSIPVASQTPNFAYPSGCLASTVSWQGLSNNSQTFGFVRLLPGDQWRDTCSVIPPLLNKVPMPA